MLCFTCTIRCVNRLVSYCRRFCSQYMLKMEEMRCLSDDYDVDIDRVDLKGCFRGGARRTVTYSDERCEQHRPSGPHTPSERASRNLFVESGVECDPTQLTSAAHRVVPVAGPTGNISTLFYLSIT